MTLKKFFGLSEKKEKVLQYKICTLCDIEKPISEYNGNKKHSWCNSCSKENNFKRNLWKEYRLTIDNYNELVLQQNNKCAICGKNESCTSNGSKEIKKLSVDHDHSNGKIRGLLCYKCNIALGFFDDNIDLLMKAIEYLKKSE
jgi:hypothetical protein